MSVRRWVLALLLVVCAIQNALLTIYTTSLKFGWTKPAPDTQRLVSLSNTSSVLQLAAGWIAIALFFFAAWRLVRRKSAFGPYVMAFVLSAGNWLSFKLGSVYDRTFTPAEQKFDYVLLAMMVILGVAIWYFERMPTRTVRR